MLEEKNKEKTSHLKSIITKPENVYESFLVFLLSGLLFIIVAKISLNLSLFVENAFIVIVEESAFLLLSFLSAEYLFSKIKNKLFSYSLYYLSTGLFGLFVIEMFLNKNYNFGYFPLFFLFLLKSFEASIARVAIDKTILAKTRELFLKKVLLAYLIYVSISSLVFFALAKIMIWSYLFVFLNLIFALFFYIFLYRLKQPKQEKEEKPLFDDVTFY